jgi:transporter family protein
VGHRDRESGVLNQIQTRSWAFLVLSGVATGLSWLCYFRVFQLGPASEVAPVDKLSLVVAVTAAAILLGETISVGTWIGAAMVVAGVLILATS